MSFESLEEGYFLAGEWRELVSLYERRLESPELSPETGSTARARLVLRLGQVLEERCLDMDGAEQKYAEAIELDPSHRPAMVQLRRVYSLRERWDKYLALTQRESEQPMRPFERASFYTEVGDVWLHQLGDPQQAVGQFEMALEADADHVNALLGLADAHEKSGSAEQAATALARAIERLRGSERSPVLVSLGKLYAKSLDQPDRAMEAYKRALTDDPECRPALDALADRARVDQNWELFEDLQERLYHATKNEIQRLAVVHEAGRVHLEDHQDAEAARIWFERALELFPDDPVVHLYLADIERMTGNQKALSSHLRRAVDLAENAAPTDLLQESAKYAIDEGDDDVAVEQLQRALDRRPGDEQISADLIAALSRLGRDDELVSLLAEEARNAPSGSEAQINAWLRVGTHHEERLGDTAQALDAYAQAFDVDPSSEAAGMAYARLLTEKENWSDLRQLHERVVRHGDSSASQRLNSWCELGEIGIGRLDDPAGAQEAFQRAVELDPECVQANEGLERVALALGDDDALLEAFEREAEVTTNRDRLSFLVWELARIYESQEEPARALHWLDRLTEASPEDVRALEACARLREDLGQREALGATLEILDPLLTGEAQAKNRSRAARLWMELGDRTRALHATRAVLEAEPDDLDSLRNLDGLLSAARDTHELIDVRRHLVSLVHGEERIAGLESLGRLQMDAGDSAAALDAWSEVLDAGAGEPGLDLEVESLLSDLGRWEPLCARIAARREGMDPLDPRAFELDVTRAELMLDKLDRAEDAIELFDLARDANPGSIRAREGLERALRCADRNDRLVGVLAERAEEEANAEERARLTLERATLLEQTLNQLPEARTVLAEIADGDSALAQDADQRLLALLERTEDWSALRERKQAGLGQHGGERDLEIHLELAELSLERLEDRTAAVFHLEAAVEIDASRAETWQQLNRLYQRAEDHEGTLRAIEAELATGPDDERSALLHARAAELSLDELSNEAGAERHFAALLQLEPSHARAAEFLGDRYEKAERHNDLVALWRGQLSVMAEAELERGADASLRLRMAALLATDDHDLAGAIAALEPAAEREITLSVVAEPLADLYERSGDREALLQLAQRAAPACDVPGERAGWNLRIADALRTKQELAAAAEAYRQVLVDRPEERGAQSALRALYRKLDEPEPLVRLLESELSRVGGVAEIPIRVELADLLANALDRSGDALVHLRRVLQLEPTHASALDRALELATQVERHDETLELLGLAIERTRNPVARSSLLARRGTLEADVLARPAEALESFREAQQLTPHDADINARVRRLLDLTGEWEGSLEAIEREVANLPERSREAKEALLQEAADLAEERVGGDAVLPWLARLRALRPGDTTLLARIAGLHRDAGRFEDLLRTLEEEIAAGPEPERRAALEQERAQIFANELQAPGRAIAALEEARKAAPGSTEILRELEGLYQSAGRDRDRAQVLDVLIDRTEGVERLKSRRAAAQVAKDLGSTEKSLDYLWQALPDAGDGLDRVEILRELQDLWPRLGRKDLWARVAEAELASLDPSAPVFAERRNEVRWLLADAYRSELARPDKAERHLRALLDETQTDVDPQITQRAQNALIGLLRRSGDAVELEARLSARLADLPTEESQDFAQVAMDWLELARLRKERLHRIGLAAEAYQQASLSDPESLEAVRGLRECADRLGRPADVAAALERELELRADASPSERAGLYRALGEITWRRLDATTRASRAFASALEADPKDRVSLRSLQTLFETMEDWRGAADLYESEVTVLGDDEPGRRQEAWLRVGALSRDHLEEPARALAAYDQAAELGELELAERLHWAELLDDAGEKERFTEVFTSWLDAEGSSDEIADHLRLATTLGEIDQPEEALARVERALALESEHLDAWDLSAQLNERLERFDDAATAHERAAACTRGTDAARRRLQAAHQVHADEDRVRLLDRAVADDPSCAEGHAMLAIAAAGLGQTTQAERASLRALELAKTSELPSELLRDAALSGGRAALEQDHGTQALDLFAAVLEIDPNHTEALAGHGEVALQLGDSVLARPSLEQLLSQEGELPDRAVHLARLGQAVEAAGDTAEALGHYRKALEIDSRLDDAHRGLTELLEREEQIDEAVDALQNWAARTREPNVRAGRLMHAARLELDRPGREEPAEALLREAVSTRPDDAIAWAFLCNLIWSQGRTTEALDQATRAVEALEEGIEVAPCSLIRGRALEQRGDHRAAADAFRLAVECDPRCTEGALSAARLLRALGEWRESADVLQIFVDHAPGDIVDQLAPAWHQLGRLLAGPLEDVDGAIEVYQRALNTDPNIEDARASLADLLVHRPDRWDEATEQHQQLLSEDPTRLASLRGLLQISRGREREDATMAGLAILRALGCASPEERVEAPARLAGATGGSPLSDPTGEMLRQLAGEIAQEIGDALGVGSTGESQLPAGSDPITRLRSALTAAEGQLTAPALVPLTNEELGSVLTLAAELALEVESVQADGDLVNSLSKALGRRTRRRIRKTLDGLNVADLPSIDWNLWRLELRGEAALRALDDIDGELRSAFVAWIEDADGEEAGSLAPESDLRDLVSANPQSLVFLNRLLQHWMSRL